MTTCKERWIASKRIMVERSKCRTFCRRRMPGNRVSKHFRRGKGHHAIPTATGDPLTATVATTTTVTITASCRCTSFEITG